MPFFTSNTLFPGSTVERTTWTLALACIDCNLHKGANLTGIDPDTNRITELSHPRRQSWNDHFEWRGLHLLGKTPIGRTTVRVLAINSEDQLALRSS